MQAQRKLEKFLSVEAITPEKVERCRVKSLCLRKTLGSWLHLA
jgi:ribosomal protein L20A (L18A)